MLGLFNEHFYFRISYTVAIQGGPERMQQVWLLIS